jgi:ADP-heptose:LPS heptosyltransferase
MLSLSARMNTAGARPQASAHSRFWPLPTAASRLRARAARGLYVLINGWLAIIARLLWPRGRPASAASILIFRTGHIGDVTCALPAMRAVREAYPRARITLLTSTGRVESPGALELLDGVDWIDEIDAYQSSEVESLRGILAFAKRLRRRRFDLWVNLSGNLIQPLAELKYMMFAKLVGPRWARGWCIDSLPVFAQAQSENHLFENEVERCLTIVRRFGFNPANIEFGLPRPDQVVARIDELQAGLALDRFAVLAPGAKRSTNRWPAANFVEVGRNLRARGLKVVVLGGEADRSQCMEIARGTGVGAVSLAGELTLAESCEILRRCLLVICVDSGVQHLASAVGTRCISLFSFWQMRGKWHPYGEWNIVLQKRVPCHTCLLETCPHQNRCMRLIQTHEVLYHVAGALADSSSGSRAGQRAETRTAH